MRKVVPFALLALVFVVAGVALAGSSKSVFRYRASMASGAEVPKPKGAAGAAGAFTAIVTESGSTRTIAWKLTFTGLTGRAVAAHIHKGKPGVPGAVIVPLCGPCKSGQTGQVKISRDVADLLESGRAYVNVHTSKNAGGEIRGQVRLVAHADGTSLPQATDPTTTTPDDGGPPAYY